MRLLFPTNAATSRHPAAEGFKLVVQSAWQSCARPTTDASEIGFCARQAETSEGRGRRVRISVKNQSERPNHCRQKLSLSVGQGVPRQRQGGRRCQSGAVPNGLGRQREKCTPNYNPGQAPHLAIALSCDRGSSGSDDGKKGRKAWSAAAHADISSRLKMGGWHPQRAVETQRSASPSSAGLEGSDRGVNRAKHAGKNVESGGLTPTSWRQRRCPRGPAGPAKRFVVETDRLDARFFPA